MSNIKAIWEIQNKDCTHLWFSVYRFDVATAVHIPKSYMTISASSSGGKKVQLPWTPRNCLRRNKIS